MPPDPGLRFSGQAQGGLRICVPRMPGKGRTYVISPGNLGAVIFVDRFYKKGKKGVTAAELVGNICPCLYNRKGKGAYGHAGGGKADCGISGLPDADGNPGI